MPESKPAPGVETLRLRIKDGSGVREVPLAGKDRYDFGRDSVCAVALADTKCSRRHVELVRGPDGWEVLDLGSRNGILVNGKKTNRVLLRTGDVVLLGTSEVTLLGVEGGEAKPATAAAPANAALAATAGIEPSRPVPVLSTALPVREVTAGAGDAPVQPARTQAREPKTEGMLQVPGPAVALAGGPPAPARGLSRRGVVTSTVITLVLVAVAVGAAKLASTRRGEHGGGASPLTPAFTPALSPEGRAGPPADAGGGRRAPGSGGEESTAAAWSEREAQAEGIDDLLAFYLAEEARLAGTPLAERAGERATALRRLRDGGALRRIATLRKTVGPLLDAREYARATDLCHALEADLGIQPPPAGLSVLASEIAGAAAADLARLRKELEALQREGRTLEALLRLEREHARYRGVVSRDALAALGKELEAAVARGGAPGAPGAETAGPRPPAAGAAAGPAAVPAAAAAATPKVTADRVAELLAAVEPAWHAYRYAEVRARLEALRAEAGEKPPAELTAALAELADEQALFGRLLTHIADPAARPIELPLDDNLSGRVVRADATRFEAEGVLAVPGGGGGKVEFGRAWAEIPPIQLYQQFLSALGLTGEAYLPVAGFLWNHHLEGEGMSLLVRLRRAGGGGGGATAAAVDAFLARRCGLAVPAGGFVEAEGRLLTPEEREAVARKRMEDERRAHEAETASKAAAVGERASRLAAQVAAAEKESNYALARQLLAALAAHFPDTAEGKRAKVRLASPLLAVLPLVENGPAENRYDLIIAGDGYTVEQQDSLLKQAKRIAEHLFREEPFKEYASYFNVRAALLESREAGFDIVPGSTRKDTALGGASSNDLMTVDHDLVRRHLGGVPNDGLVVVLINGGGTTGTGGGGVLAMGSSAAAILHHEIGHAMAGLGDEYETKVGAAALGPSSEGKKHRPGFENVNGEWVRLKELPPRALAANLMEGSDLEHMKAACPWRHWIEKGQDNWRSHGVQEVGFFEGGGMKTHDIFRPQRDCKMRDASIEYCVVCMERMVLALHRGVRGIDAWEPKEDQVAVLSSKPFHFQVRAMAPRTHALTVEWSVKPIDVREKRPGDTVAAEIPGRPLPGGIARGKDGAAVYFCDLGAGALSPGTYDVTARSADPTPYVLADPEKRLQSARTWRLEVR
ncbi:MAG: FHA domain-containing protein [Planctomycetes bacterium]|nr:FHA domain-containing protein [Planctomycetota bacterium]